MKRLFRKLGRALGVDADDCQVISLGLILVLLLGLVVVLLAGALGLAAFVFIHLAGL
jgi:hypothetical protein